MEPFIMTFIDYIHELIKMENARIEDAITALKTKS